MPEGADEDSCREMAPPSPGAREALEQLQELLLMQSEMETTDGIPATAAREDNTSAADGSVGTPWAQADSDLAPPCVVSQPVPFSGVSDPKDSARTIVKTENVDNEGHSLSPTIACKAESSPSSPPSTVPVTGCDMSTTNPGVPYVEPARATSVLRPPPPLVCMANRANSQNSDTSSQRAPPPLTRYGAAKENAGAKTRKPRRKKTPRLKGTIPSPRKDFGSSHPYHCTALYPQHGGPLQVAPRGSVNMVFCHGLSRVPPYHGNPDNHHMQQPLLAGQQQDFSVYHQLAPQVPQQMTPPGQAAPSSRPGMEPLPAVYQALSCAVDTTASSPPRVYQPAHSSPPRDDYTPPSFFGPGGELQIDTTVVTDNPEHDDVIRELFGDSTPPRQTPPTRNQQYSPVCEAVPPSNVHPAATCRERLITRLRDFKRFITHPRTQLNYQKIHHFRNEFKTLIMEWVPQTEAQAKSRLHLVHSVNKLVTEMVRRCAKGLMRHQTSQLA